MSSLLNKENLLASADPPFSLLLAKPELFLDTLSLRALGSVVFLAFSFLWPPKATFFRTVTKAGSSGRLLPLLKLNGLHLERHTFEL